MKKLPAVLMASAMTIGSIAPTFAVTPPLNIKVPQISDIKISVDVPGTEDTDKKDDVDQKDDKTDAEKQYKEAQKQFEAWAKKFFGRR